MDDDRYHIKHTPLSAAPYCVLRFSNLSRFARDVPDFEVRGVFTFRNVELKALATTICETVNRPYITLTAQDFNNYRKLLNHITSQLCPQDYTSRGLVGLLVARSFELEDEKCNRVPKLRLGSLICGECGGSKFTDHLVQKVIKNYSFNRYVECKRCQAFSPIQDGLLVGLPANEFNWIKRLQLNKVVQRNVKSGVYSLEEMSISILNFSSRESIFDINPFNSVVVSSRLKRELSRFQTKSEMLNRLQYHIDKKIAEWSYDSHDKPMPAIRKFLMESERFDAEAPCLNVADLRSMLELY